MRVTHTREKDTATSFAFLCVSYLDRWYQCEVSKAVAGDSPLARWWADRGNGEMAEYEALKWATKEAYRMARRAFREATP